MLDLAKYHKCFTIAPHKTVATTSNAFPSDYFFEFTPSGCKRSDLLRKCATQRSRRLLQLHGAGLKESTDRTDLVQQEHVSCSGERSGSTILGSRGSGEQAVMGGGGLEGGDQVHFFMQISSSRRRAMRVCQPRGRMRM